MTAYKPLVEALRHLANLKGKKDDKDILRWVMETRGLKSDDEMLEWARSQLSGLSNDEVMEILDGTDQSESIAKVVNIIMSLK